MAKYTQTSFSAGELSPALRRRVDLERYVSALEHCENCIVEVEGGVSNRAGTTFIAPSKGGPLRMIPFLYSRDATYVLGLGDQYMWFFINGGVLLEVPSAITGITNATSAVVTCAALHNLTAGRWVYISGVQGMTEINGGPYEVTAVTATTITLDLDSSGFGTYTSGGDVDPILEVSTPYTQAQLFEVNYSQRGSQVIFVHPSHAPRELVRVNPNEFTFSTISYGTSLAAPTGLTGQAGGTQKSYVVTAVDSVTGDESVASTAANHDETSTTALTWTNATGADSYNVYKGENGIYGFIGSSSDGTTGFVDQSLIPDIEDSPPEDRTVFAGANDYPAAVTFFEQRSIYAGSNNEPQVIYMSQIGNTDNFNVSFPLKSTDAITIKIESDEINRIDHLYSLLDLLVFTQGAEFKVTSGDNPFTLENIRRRKQSRRGIARGVRPLLAGDTLLFVTSRGGKIRDFSYNVGSDGYTGRDLTLLARHFFKQQSLVDWAYAEEPNSIVWVVRADGVLLGMTYDPSSEIIGWHQHNTDGEFQSVAAIPETGGDGTYFCVKRNVDGTDRYYVERLANRDFTDIATDATFVDSALRYSGSPVSTLSGLEHLEGKEVSILADGSLHPRRTVSSGSITLDKSYSEVVVGLPYVSKIRTLEAPQAELIGNEKSVGRVIVNFENSRGLRYGNDPDDPLSMTDLKASLTAYGSPPELITDDVEIVIDPSWKYRGRFWVVQEDPLPMTVLSLTPDVEVGQ